MFIWMRSSLASREITFLVGCPFDRDERLLLIQDSRHVLSKAEQLNSLIMLGDER